MAHDLIRPAKARRGERIAVLSPPFATAGAYPAVHEQAMPRLAEVTGLVPVEYPTTRMVGATPQARAADLVGQYNPGAIVCVGIRFGHTRPQWILPHGGLVTVDGTARQVVADYS